jgi:arylsulfatase A-like enzyme
MTRRTFLSIPAVLSAQTARRPNILLLFADDLGYASISAYGCDIPTPNIDSIAKNGVRFTNGYVSCPVCSPTRAGLMTGRYQQRFGHEFNPGPAEQADADFGLPLTETTLPQRLKSLGYHTAMVGKWHLGYQPQYHPLKRGFDEFFGFLGGAHPYLPMAGRANAILRGTEPVRESEYLTDAFAREALAFLDRPHEKPFFLYLAFNAVHNPLQATEKYLGRFPNISDTRRRTWAAMLSAMDDAVGRVLAKVPQDTLIFFISDNGGPTAATTSRNDPLRGVKGQTYEGGIRVPFLMQWRGHLPVGKTYDQPAIALDVLPTCVAAAGGSIPPDARLDGVNLLPYLTGSSKGAPHETLYWRSGQQGAARRGDWKLVVQPDSGGELYNLAKDISESQNLATSNKEKHQELRSAYDAWTRTLMEPRWRAQRMARRKRRR